LLFPSRPAFWRTVFKRSARTFFPAASSAVQFVFFPLSFWTRFFFRTVGAHRFPPTSGCRGQPRFRVAVFLLRLRFPKNVSGASFKDVFGGDGWSEDAFSPFCPLISFFFFSSLPFPSRFFSFSTAASRESVLYFAGSLASILPAASLRVLKFLSRYTLFLGDDLWRSTAHLTFSGVTRMIEEPPACAKSLPVCPACSSRLRPPTRIFKTPFYCSFFFLSSRRSLLFFHPFFSDC